MLGQKAISVAATEDQTETEDYKMKDWNGTKIIGVDHGYGNILCKEIYNPDIL